MLENYKVVLVESDFYARSALNSYLARDRRTRVMELPASLSELDTYLLDCPPSELPDTILLDSLLLPTAAETDQSLRQILKRCRTDIIVLAHHVQEDLAQTVRRTGGQGYVARAEVGLQIAWMVVWAKNYEFITTPKTANWFTDAAILPEGREYPELTERVRQALLLCVVDGVSTELAADEMGLSPHTIRTYIKEGYSILEAQSHLDYPADLSPQEKAFMRFTALQDTPQPRAKRRTKR